MPGLTIAVGFSKPVEQAFPGLLDPPYSVVEQPPTGIQITIRMSHLAMFFLKYDGYPTTIFEDGRFTYALDGRIHGLDGPSIRSAVKSAFEASSNHSKVSGRLSDELGTLDGEFVMVRVDRMTGDVDLITDILGHLPTYCVKRDDGCIISRDISLMHRVVPTGRLSREGILDVLLFGHTFGANTLLADVKRLPRACVLSIKPASHRIEASNYHELNFEQPPRRWPGDVEGLQELIKLFVEACEKRTKSRGNRRALLSLSGGLDSRAVAGGLMRAGAGFGCITYLLQDGRSKRDVDIARKLAGVLKKDWEKVEPSPMLGQDVLELLAAKGGLNYLVLANLLAFHRILGKRAKEMSVFTGDSGMVLRDYMPESHISGYDDALDHLFSSQGRFFLNPVCTFKEAANLLGMDVQSVKSHVLKILENFPERNMGKRVQHFIFQGYHWSNHYEGIDRTRHYFWPEIPLESTPFFMLAVSCPDEYKTDYRLYGDFLAALWPALATVPTTNNIITLDRSGGKRIGIKGLLAKTLPKSVKRRIREMRTPGNSREREIILGVIDKQLKKSPEISRMLNLGSGTRTLRRMSKYQLWTILTVTSQMELHASGKSSLEDIRGLEFN